MNKFVIAITLCTSTCFLRHKSELVPLTYSYSYDAFPMYQTWFNEVRSCVITTANVDTSFRIDSAGIRTDIAEITWIAVPTEREDGGFIWFDRRPYWGMRVGTISIADTIFLSGQMLNNKRVVKHEIMHILVDSPTELSPEHGRPWGLCEYL